MVGSFFRRVTDTAATGCILETRTLPDEFLHLLMQATDFIVRIQKSPAHGRAFLLLQQSAANRAAVQ